MKLSNKSGFTLLEIIIVIIIIGVLASLALPRFINTVEASRGGEALQQMSAIRGAISRCGLRDNSYANCNVFGNLDVVDPTTQGGSHFSYALTTGATTFYIQARRNTQVDGGADDYISLTHDDALGVTKSGTGAFSDIR